MGVSRGGAGGNSQGGEHGGLEEAALSSMSCNHEADWADYSLGRDLR